METKRDPYTGEWFTPKRSNQKFENAKNKNDYHNEKTRELRERLKWRDKPLKDNLKILDKLMEGEDKVLVHNQFLEGLGFDFTVYNGIEKYEGVHHPVVYNYLIIRNESSDKIKIVRYD